MTRYIHIDLTEKQKHTQLYFRRKEPIDRQSTNQPVSEGYPDSIRWIQEHQHGK